MSADTRSGTRRRALRALCPFCVDKDSLPMSWWTQARDSERGARPAGRLLPQAGACASAGRGGIASAALIGQQHRPSTVAEVQEPATDLRVRQVGQHVPTSVVPSAPVGQVVVVEGTLDAMAIAVAAIRSGRSQEFCPITQSGRELSPRQLASIAELARPIVLAFDGDAAGRDSASGMRDPRSASGLPTWVTRLPVTTTRRPGSLMAEAMDFDVWSVER